MYIHVSMTYYIIGVYIQHTTQHVILRRTFLPRCKDNNLPVTNGLEGGITVYRIPMVIMDTLQLAYKKIDENGG